MSGYGGYGQQQNPYAQQDNPYGGAAGGYGNGGYNQQQDIEMGSVATEGAGAGGDDYHQFLDKVNNIRQGIDEVNQKIDQIEFKHKESLTRIEDLGPDRELEALVASTSSLNQQITYEIRKLKGSKHGSQRQVSNLDKNFKDCLRRYQLVEKKYADSSREQMTRQLRIAKPEATEQEILEEVESGQTNIFQQASLESGRRQDRATSALREAKRRRDEVQRIEKTIVELAQLFEQMDQLVTEQEEVVARVDEQGEQVQQNVVKAEEEITGAVDKARSARRKKWWCLLIVLLIIIVIVIIAVVVTLVNKK